jgi:hypothetical protein
VRVKRSEFNADNLFSISVDIKNAWRYISTFPYGYTALWLIKRSDLNLMAVNSIKFSL